jgi:hypothetical protein
MPNQPSQEESIIGDGSAPLFSLYFEAMEEEDNRFAKTEQKDADRMPVFVSPRIGIQIKFLCE